MGLFNSKSTSERLLTVAGGMLVSAVGLVLVPVMMDTLDKLAGTVRAHQELLDAEDPEDIPEYEE